QCDGDFRRVRHVGRPGLPARPPLERALAKMARSARLHLGECRVGRREKEEAMSANWLVAAQQALGLFPILSEANGMDERPLVSDSKQRVALELMQIIVDREHKTKI